MPVRSGFVHGTGNALNVEIGFVPDYLRLVDITNGDIITEGYFKRIVVFTSLSVAISVGNYIKGATSGATARVNQVIIDTGTVAGGDAAGWLICDPFEVVGTLETEEAQVYSSKPGPNAAATDHLDIVVDIEEGNNIAAAVVQVTTAATQVTAFEGTEATLRKGFTMGATVSIVNVLFHYFAMANDPGMEGEETVLGETQSSAAGVWA